MPVRTPVSVRASDRPSDCPSALNKHASTRGARHRGAARRVPLRAALFLFGDCFVLRYFYGLPCGGARHGGARRSAAWRGATGDAVIRRELIELRVGNRRELYIIRAAVSRRTAQRRTALLSIAPRLTGLRSIALPRAALSRTMQSGTASRCAATPPRCCSSSSPPGTNLKSTTYGNNLSAACGRPCGRAGGGRAAGHVTDEHVT